MIPDGVSVVMTPGSSYESGTEPPPRVVSTVGLSASHSHMFHVDGANVFFAYVEMMNVFRSVWNSCVAAERSNCFDAYVHNSAIKV